jgi:hypothetical protein
MVTQPKSIYSIVCIYALVDILVTHPKPERVPVMITKYQKWISSGLMLDRIDIHLDA